MPLSQAATGMPGTDAARGSQHARQLDVNLFSDVKKIRLRDRNLTSEKIFTCYRPDSARRAGPPPVLRLRKLNAIAASATVGPRRADTGGAGYARGCWLIVICGGWRSVFVT